MHLTTLSGPFPCMSCLFSPCRAPAEYLLHGQIRLADIATARSLLTLAVIRLISLPQFCDYKHGLLFLDSLAVVKSTMSSTIIALISFLSFPGLTIAPGTSCYYRDGTLATKDSVYRCVNSTDLETTDSSCCNVGQICYSNGVCGALTNYLRVGCTDPSWQASECLDRCDACIFPIYLLHFFFSREKSTLTTSL